SMEIRLGTFEAWIAERLEQETMSFGAGPTPIEISEPQPYELAGYTGVSYTVAGRGPAALVIALLVREDKVIQIALHPADSSALDEGLGLLATLQDGACSS
ncbi:MAG: hypothetical protein ACRDIB_05615, partial [Ardenticatenaceae bacterium]